MVFLLLACAGEAPVEETATPAVSWYGDIRPIVEQNCVNCHNRDGIGSFPLETYEDVLLVKEPVKNAVAERRMPPWLAGPGCADYDGDLSLSDDQIALIGAWVDAGAPMGSKEDAAPSEVPEWPSMEEPDVVLELPELYTPTTDPDDYRCFVVDWPLDEPSYVIGYDVLPGNPRVVHHLVAYIAPPEHVEFYEGLDAADPGAGYSCFGGPGAPDGEDRNAADWLGGWAPGGGYSPFPEGVGIAMAPGSRVILQMHYNLEDVEPGETDLTRMRLQVADSVENPVIIQPWADPDWLDSELMDIPAGSTGVTHSFSYALPVDLTLYTANLHMHTLGVSARMVIERDDGSEECMLDIPRWDFNWQRGYRFTEPKKLKAGESVKVECTWDNPTDQDVFWGEGTGAEMCLGTMLMGW